MWTWSGDPDDRSIGTITAHVHPDNVASARVAERADLAATDEIEDGEVVWRRSGTAY